MPLPDLPRRHGQILVTLPTRRPLRRHRRFPIALPTRPPPRRHGRVPVVLPARPPPQRNQPPMTGDARAGRRRRANAGPPFYATDMWDHFVTVLHMC
jgi:hypothetical protein